MRLSNLIKAARLQAGVSQLYIAAELGYKDHSFVSKVESGSRVPSLKVAKRLGEILQIPPQALAQGFAETEWQKAMGALES